MATTATTATTTNRQRWAYSLVNLGLTITVQGFGAFALFFYTDVKRLPATWAATVMSIYAIYNALNNPVLGYLSDRTRSRWGRRIPYILFGALPMMLSFFLTFAAPFDGRTQPVALLIYFIVVIFVWEGLYTAVATGYYSLLPEMFADYKERTDVAARMNFIQTIGLIVGMALPPILSEALGWPMMAGIFAVISAAAVYIGVRGLFERPHTQDVEPLPLVTALRATFLNRSFLTVVIAQTLRFFATGTLVAGMAFYTKYSLGLAGGETSLMFVAVFVTSIPFLWIWRVVSHRMGVRATLMLAYAALAVAVVPLGLARNLTEALVAAVLIGIALAGLILLGDVILCDVIDEDETHTGRRREGMYFGLSGLITTLSGSLTALVFGWLLPAYGYNTALDVQPATVGTGFRLFMTMPPIAGAALAVLSLAFYPLYGKRLAEMKAKLAETHALSEHLQTTK